MKRIIIYKPEPLGIGLLTQTAPVDNNRALIYTDEILSGTEYLNCFGPNKLSPEENTELANKYSVERLQDSAYYYNPNRGILCKQTIRELIEDELGLEYNESEIIVNPGCRKLIDSTETKESGGILKRLFNLWQS